MGLTSLFIAVLLIESHRWQSNFISNKMQWKDVRVYCNKFSHEQLCHWYPGLHKNGKNFIVFISSFSLQALQFWLVVITIYIVAQGDKKKKDMFILKYLWIISRSMFYFTYLGKILYSKIYNRIMRSIEKICLCYWRQINYCLGMLKNRLRIIS